MKAKYPKQFILSLCEGLFRFLDTSKLWQIEPRKNNIKDSRQIDDVQDNVIITVFLQLDVKIVSPIKIIFLN